MSDDSAENRDRLKFEALSLEYNTLRQEIGGRIDRRHQTQAVLAVSGGLLAGFAPGNSAVPQDLVVSLGGALIAIALISWLHSGRLIGQLSRRLAQLEWDINVVVNRSVTNHLLSWEQDRQTSTGPWRLWRRVFLGKAWVPPHEPNESKAC